MILRIILWMSLRISCNFVADINKITMKRLSLSIAFACCTLALAAQEDGFRVNFQGAKPDIKDFAKAYITSLLNPEDEEPEGDGLYMYESIQKAMVCQENGQPIITYIGLRCATGRKLTANTNSLLVADGVSRTGRLSSDNTTVFVSTATTTPRRR